MSKTFLIFLVGTGLGVALLSGDLSAALQTLPGSDVGTIFFEEKPYSLRMVKGEAEKTYDQILLYGPSGNAIGTLAFKIRLNAASGSAVVENPLPIVTEETSLSQAAIFDTLYAGLFSYLIEQSPSAVKEGLRINFTDVPKGIAHPSITMPLLRFGFKAVGGQNVTFQIPDRSLRIPTKSGALQVPQFRSVTIGLSNRYTLTDVQQLLATLAGIVYGLGN